MRNAALLAQCLDVIFLNLIGTEVHATGINESRSDDGICNQNDGSCSVFRVCDVLAYFHSFTSTNEGITDLSVCQELFSRTNFVAGGQILSLFIPASCAQTAQALPGVVLPSPPLIPSH